MSVNEAKLRAELAKVRYWIRHWADDVSAGLRPTMSSLSKVEGDITRVLDETKE